VPEAPDATPPSSDRRRAEVWRAIGPALRRRSRELSCRCCVLQPNRLSRKTEFAVAEIFPAGLSRELRHFRKGKCARRGKPTIISGHRLAKNQRGQKIDANGGEQATS